MSKNSVSFSRFCEQLGVPLKNTRWSWSAFNPDRGKVLFTIWDNEILPDGSSYQLWNGGSDESRTDNGARELKRNTIAASAPGVEAYGIRCFPKYPLTAPRVRDYFNEDELIRLSVERIDQRYVARFLGVVPPETLSADISLSDAMLPSALDDLDDPIGSITPPRLSTNGSYYVRDAKVRNAVVKRAKGRCEYCGNPGFELTDGKRFVETHHIIHLANQGPDTLDNVIALCPNHHREAHYGRDRIALEGEFKAILVRLMPKVV